MNATPGGELVVTRFGAVADAVDLNTRPLQAAIDAAAHAGGATVRIPPGRFLTGGLRLRGGVRLHLERGAVLKGSNDHRDYGPGAWDDALLTADDASNITIDGPGLIDGSDCGNPNGEEGRRGPHGIVLTRCQSITLRDIQIIDTGNYAILCRDCHDAVLRDLRVRGGHDAVHTQGCRRFKVESCDFRTGDDCFAGCDNLDFEIRDCLLNSSCNAFRLGCVNLLVERCRLWGPGQHVHQVSGRRNMLNAFIHFAPTDRDPQLPSDNWLLRDLELDDLSAVYGYDFEQGLWQTGQPALRITLEKVRATRVRQPIRIRGDRDLRFELTLRDVRISLGDDSRAQPVIDAEQFGRIELERVILDNDGLTPPLRLRHGRSVRARGLGPTVGSALRIEAGQVEQIEID